MARKTEKFEVAAREVEERFGHRGIKLVEFSGRSNPCVIYCPEHGNQTYGRFGSMFRGNSMGCPACGKVRAAKIANASHQSVREELENLKQAITGMTKQERITTQAYNEMTKSVAGSNSIILNDVQGDTTINNHHTHTHNHSDADGKALSMRLTPRPLLSDRQAAAFARTGKLTGSFDLFASVAAPSQYTFAVAMPDTSMSPVIEKGDLLVVEPRMCPADEDIALIELSDKRLVVAHLVIDIAGRMLIYQTGRPSEAFDLPEGSTILGVVLEVKKRFMSAAQARRRVDSDYHP
ncbi:TPA: DUF723 domain-containing protein [Neisseria meningitidis]